MTGVLQVRGVLLPEAEERDLWVVDGRVTFERRAEADTVVAGGWVVPGLVDAHCHIGLAPHELVATVVGEAGGGETGGGRAWVKLVGDWIDRAEGDLTPLWPGGVLRAAVAAAHAAGARVAVHTFSEEALPDLIDAGVDSVEHGTGLTDDLVARLAASGAALVPTLVNIETFPGIAESARAKFPVYADRMLRLHGTARARVRA